MNGEIVGGRYTPMSRRPVPLEQVPGPAVQRPTVDVTGATEALTVGPDEVLVVVVHGAGYHDLRQVRNTLLDSMLRDDQILLLGAQGDVSVTIAKAPRDQIRVVQAAIDGEVTR